MIHNLYLSGDHGAINAMGLTSYIHFMNIKDFSHLSLESTLLQESIISTPISLNASGITFFSKLYLIFPFFLSICTH